MFVKQPMNVVDLMSILPFYIELAFDAEGKSSFVVLRILRLCRLFRVLKLKKYSAGFDIFTKTLYTSGPALSVLGFIIVLLTIFFGALLYTVEIGVWYSRDALQQYCEDHHSSCNYHLEFENGMFMRTDVRELKIPIP